MIKLGETSCPKCGGELKFYDIVDRCVKSKYGQKDWVKIRRLRCLKCRAIHRELPEELLPYKQYDIDMIQGVKEGLITSDTLGFEDYPCEMTMTRWIKE